MTIPQIIAYVRGTAEYAALSEIEKRAIAAEDIQALAAVLNARVDALSQTDCTQADSVREILRDLNAE